ncbi:predicted protein [Sclerotinia sclerotiorum 1980 UF-70]|uniref:Uncharacterized protein n=1 Tax=Sclerotinia sclerotiorum (strain ATCC 18683 / 1980 / Ss-1) TaxID=665079 RepID=A7EMD3_SCLS1|nr:predicted protein [Sclerotinia sclerotiorum 1980 UF-70]EDO03999.1 predicted protein [Sclerotinia sclerotiorum 1980 UF-70]
MEIFLYCIPENCDAPRDQTMVERNLMEGRKKCYSNIQAEEMFVIDSIRAIVKDADINQEAQKVKMKAMFQELQYRFSKESRGKIYCRPDFRLQDYWINWVIEFRWNNLERGHKYDP